MMHAVWVLGIIPLTVAGIALCAVWVWARYREIR
jgi:hypothetical protein